MLVGMDTATVAAPAKLTTPITRGIEVDGTTAAVIAVEAVL